MLCIKTLFFYLLLTGIVLSQTSFGFCVNPFIYNSILNKEISTLQSISKENKVNIGISPGLLFGVKVDNYIEFDFCLSAFLGELYQGLDTGILLNYNLSSNSYLITGLNTHFNLEGGGHTYAPQNIIIPFAVIGYGYRLNSNIRISSELNAPLNNGFYGIYTEQAGGPDYYRIKHLYKMGLQLKLGIIYEWKL